MSKYKREEIITKLIQNGLKPVYKKDSKWISHFTKSKNKPIGIKLLGYLDFLGVEAK